MNMLEKAAMAMITAALLSGCQSEEERTRSARDTMTASCLQRTQGSPSMQDVDPVRFCDCLADGLLAQGVDGPPPDTAAVGERCQLQARGAAAS